MPEDSRKVAGGTRKDTRGSIKCPRRQRKYSTGENLTYPFTNRRMPNGTYGGVRGRGREAPAYSIRTNVVEFIHLLSVRFLSISAETLNSLGHS